MALSEMFQVPAIIEKLPYGRRISRVSLSTNRKEMTLEDFIVRFQIEEGNRRSKHVIPVGARVNVIEHGQGSKLKKNKAKFGLKEAYPKIIFKGNAF